MAAVAGGSDWDAAALDGEIASLRKRYDAQADSEQPSPRLQYEFACLLVCSPKRADIREGVRLLDELLEAGFHRAEVLHHLSLSYFKLGQYVHAKRYLDMWLSLQPRHATARLLHSLVLDRTSHDGLVGFFSLGLLGAAVAFAVFRRWR
mmetsp:Transcript_118864/g.236832  ORF Transcript_118864/g.236832 Transcript_118864/m.236832 type:complete len:149 (+) Transcript_118864:143-589(+)